MNLAGVAFLGGAWTVIIAARLAYLRRSAISAVSRHPGQPSSRPGPCGSSPAQGPQGLAAASLSPGATPGVRRSSPGFRLRLSPNTETALPRLTLGFFPWPARFFVQSAPASGDVAGKASRPAMGYLPTLTPRWFCDRRNRRGRRWAWWFAMNGGLK